MRHFADRLRIARTVLRWRQLPERDRKSLQDVSDARCSRAAAAPRPAADPDARHRRLLRRRAAAPTCAGAGPAEHPLGRGRWPAVCRPGVPAARPRARHPARNDRPAAAQRSFLHVHRHGCKRAAASRGRHPGAGVPAVLDRGVLGAELRGHGGCDRARRGAAHGCAGGFGHAGRRPGYRPRLRAAVRGGRCRGRRGDRRQRRGLRHRLRRTGRRPGRHLADQAPRAAAGTGPGGGTGGRIADSRTIRRTPASRRNRWLPVPSWWMSTARTAH
jgi:hypothetical protein